MVDEDAEMAKKLNAVMRTFPGRQVPPTRETGPELPEEEDEALAEMKRVMGERAIEMLMTLVGGASKIAESLCLIGPSLSRIADAHEKMAAEAKIHNEAYVHDVDQRHHSVKG